MHGPGVNFGERVVLVDEAHQALVVVLRSGKELLVHAGAVGALQIVVVYDRDLGLGVAAHRPLRNRVDRLRVLADVELLEPCQCVAVLGQQKRDRGLLAVVGKCHRQIIEIRNVALGLSAQRDVVLWWDIELRADQNLDATLDGGARGMRTLSVAAEGGDGSQCAGEEESGTEQANRLSLHKTYLPLSQGPRGLANRREGATHGGPAQTGIAGSLPRPCPAVWVSRST